MRGIRTITIISLLLVLISITSNIYAADKTMWQQSEEWIEIGTRSGATFDTNVATSRFEEIASILMGVGIFVAIGVGIILGIKFMFSTAEGKAEISKLLVPYLIGIVIVVGALAIWKIAIGILDVV